MKIECNVIKNDYKQGSFLFVFGNKKRFNSDKTTVIVFTESYMIKSKEIKRIK